MGGQERRPWKVFRGWLPAALLWVAGCGAHGGAGDGPVVRSLELHGVRQLSEELVQQSIVTEPTGPWPFSDPKRFDPYVWRLDLRRIERFYEARGFYQARVVADEVKPLEEGVALSVTVEEGDPTRVSQVKLSGLDALPEEDREAVLEAIPYQEGDILEEQRWEGLRERLQALLSARGYATASVEGEVVVRPEEHRAEVNLRFAPGPLHTFGSFVLSAETPVGLDVSRILAEAQAEIPPGTRYSRERLRDLQARLYRMGLFRSVRIAPAAPAENAVPILIDVTALPEHTVSLGAGLGLAPGRHEVRLVGGYLDRRFLGGLNSLRITGRWGYAAVPSVPSLIWSPVQSQHGLVARIGAELERQRLGRSPELRGFVGVEGERDLQEAFSALEAGGTVGVVWEPRPEVALTVSYHLRGARLGGRARAGDPPLAAALGCLEGCTLSSLEQRLARDTRDSPIDPRSGALLALSIEEAGGPLGGSADFVRIEPQARGYVTLGERFTLAGRAVAGSIFPLRGSSVPVIERYFSGGGSSMRGFGERRLSPLQVIPLEDGRAIAVPVGGLGLLELSGEIRYRFGARAGVALFADAATVTRDSLLEGLGTPQVAFGIGGRYALPVGLVRLDVAFRPPIGGPLPVAQAGGLSAPVGEGCFGIGGAKSRAGGPDGLCGIFLSIGETF